MSEHLKPLAPSLTQLVNSDRPASRSDQGREAHAWSRTEQLYRCYRKDDAHDPATFAGATAAILAEFPTEIMDYVTDPRTGLPGRLKWPPQPSEVKEACEVRAHEIERAREIGRLSRVKVSLPPPREPVVLLDGQVTYAEVMRLGIRPIGRFERPHGGRPKTPEPENQEATEASK